jgi:transglutaminase-like putative cysteine protease
MLIRYGYDITIQCDQPTPTITMLSVNEERAADARAPDAFHTIPAVPTTIYCDSFGNVCRRFTAPIGDLQLWGDGTIEDPGTHDPVVSDAKETPIADLPDDCLVFLLGSRYCETDKLSQIAWNLFQNVSPGWARAQAICDFAHQHISFDYQNPSSQRSAYDVYHTRVGVCRDFAHLAIALCRCMNMPARYVNGYLGDIGVPIVDPMDYSAWIEIFLDGRWRTFDPRNNIPRIGRIVVARGRDAADVPLINSFGPHLLKGFRVWAYEV